MQDTFGIDMSKDTLDIHRRSDGRHARFGNDRADLAALRRWIGKAPVRIVYEATYVKVREGGRIVSRVAIIAVAVNEDGKREVLGVATGPSEAETCLGRTSSGLSPTVDCAA